MLNGKQVRRAARTKIREQPTTFVSAKGFQSVPGKQLRAFTPMYPPGPRRTTKPE